jgi:hypothetical protein
VVGELSKYTEGIRWLYSDALATRHSSHWPPKIGTGHERRGGVGGRESLAERARQCFRGVRSVQVEGLKNKPARKRKTKTYNSQTMAMLT